MDILKLYTFSHQVDFNLIRKTCNIYQTYKNAEDSWVDLLDATKFVADYSKTVANYTGSGSWNHNYYVSFMLITHKIIYNQM